VHELCHRIHHDHSVDFWAAVAAARPTYAEERAWLAEHGPELLAYRVPRRRAA
jgi:predicted metal-dependent hydrolase